MSLIRIDCLVGARPNFIKMASIYRAVQESGMFAPRLIHTGQHYSPEMSDVFFQELGIPFPDFNLGVGPGSQAQQTAEAMIRLEPVLESSRPRALIVVGDVNSTVAGALVAAKMGVAVAHVEAGLRSFDRRMPEEINRVVTDSISDFLFVSEPSGVENLLREGVSRERIFFTGNVMIDTLLRFRDRAIETRAVERLGLPQGGYAVVTLHRPSNVDDPRTLAGLGEILEKLAARIPVVFPIHPRTRARMDAASLALPGVLLIPPQSYLEFLCLLAGARLVLTDSGGIQEETTILGVPCLTLRDNTERPVTIRQGTNRLVGNDPQAILRAAGEVLDRPMSPTPPPELWDGKAARRIVDVLIEQLPAG